MSITRKTKRPKRAGRRLDLSAMKEALTDGLLHVTLGVVTAEDATSHYELVDGDLLLEVEIAPDGERVTARMGCVGGGEGLGLWFIPPVGSEVAVLVPMGEVEFGPVVVGVLSSGALPDGVAENTVVIAQAKVLIHDGAGGAAPLPTLEEFKTHVHPSGTGPTGVPTDPIPGTGPIVGTTVLEAK